MADFPCLELMTPDADGRAVGTRVSVSRLPFVVGRASNVELSIRSGQLAQRHCEVVRELDRWWVRDLGSTNGTFHGGERINDAELRDGDCFELGEGIVLRLLLTEPVDVRDEQMEHALLAQPDDEERWSVYADWLQERGSPLGERMLRHEPADDFRWLGPLAGDAGRGELQVRWAHGLPVHAMLRSLSGAPVGQWQRRLGILLAAPAFRFLRELELDCGSFQRQRPQVEWGVHTLASLGTSLPWLERLVIGPGTPPPDLVVLESVLAARRLDHPRFTTTAATLFRDWQKATVTEAAEAIALPRQGHTLFPRGGAPMLRIHFADDRWVVVSEAEGGVRLNGAERRTHAYLRPGDVLTLADGQALRFDA